MQAGQTTDSNAQGTGKNDQQYDDAKSTLLLPFSMYTSSITTDYRSRYSDQFGLDFTNLHEDKYGVSAEIPMQGPFTEKHVGGMQHRHVKLNLGSDTRMTRPEGWHLQEFLNQSYHERLLYETFAGATTTATTDVTILSIPLGPGTSATGEDREPSPYEYWNNGSNSDNQWTFLQGTTPSPGTGPATTSGKFAYCEVLPTKVGQTFGLATPLMDLLEVDSGSEVIFSFSYHMHGAHIGNLKIQASLDRSFQTGVEDLLVYWSTISGYSTVLAGEQQSNASDSFESAYIGANSYGTALSNYLGKRFYIRFLYTASAGHLGDCAIDNVVLYKSGGTTYQDSFKLLHPTYDNHHRPYATLTRDNLAKSPVNIKNIEMTGSSPTIAGNYLNRYEYVSTISPEANDPFFVKNVDKINATTAERPHYHKIEDLLKLTPGTKRTEIRYSDYTLPNRAYLTGSVKNRTRIMTKFSSPGGFEAMSRGFLDPAHETFSVYNVTTYKNFSSRTILNTQLQAHCGQFGVSTHGAGSATHLVGSGSARVFGSEATGSISSLNYNIVGDAAKHKYHRNNIEKMKISVSTQDFDNASVVTASIFDNAFVSHMIPRTDNQTRWITSSIN